VTRIPSLGPRGEGWVILQIGLILFIAVAGAPALPEAIARLAGDWPLVVAGAAGIGIGAWIVLSATRRLGDSFSALPRPHEQATLIQDGLYARVRHPIYAGVICLGLGWAAVTRSLPALIAAVILAAVIDFKARREEFWLAERFPDYAEYRSRTHRFIPGLY
jgi:protein-S-isoprenylcysteine O-methyltransferase Ste14